MVEFSVVNSSQSAKYRNEQSKNIFVAAVHCCGASAPPLGNATSTSSSSSNRPPASSGTADGDYASPSPPPPQEQRTVSISISDSDDDDDRDGATFGGSADRRREEGRRRGRKRASSPVTSLDSTPTRYRHSSASSVEAAAASPSRRRTVGRPPSPPPPSKRRRRRGRRLRAADVEFKDGDDPRLDRLPDHPASKLKPSASALLEAGKAARCLEVFCHVQAHGHGICRSDILQIGLYCSPTHEIDDDHDDDDRFSEVIPVEVPHLPDHELERFGFVVKDGAIHFRHPRQRSLISCKKPHSAMKAVAKFIFRAFKKLGRECDGVVLVFAHAEGLALLLKAMSAPDVSASAVRDIKTLVNGCRFIEHPVREACLDGGRGRISLSLAYSLAVLGKETEEKQFAAADDAARALADVSRALRLSFDGEVDLEREHTFKFSSRLVNEVEKFAASAADLSRLRRAVAKELEQSRKTVVPRGMFSTFPASPAQNEGKGGAAVFVELLVGAGYTKDKIREAVIVKGMGGAAKEMKKAILSVLSEQTYKAVATLDFCLEATVAWCGSANTPPPPPPPRPPDISDLEPLRRHLEKELMSSESPRQADRISTEMVTLWARCAMSARELRRKVEAASPRLKSHLKEKLVEGGGERDEYPESWNRYGLDFLVKNTMAFFAFEVDRDRRIRRGDPPTPPRRPRSPPAHYSGRHSRSPPPHPSEVKLDPASLGLGTRRKYPTSELELLHDFVTRHQSQAQILEKATDELKMAYPLWEATPARCIVLDVLKLMKKSGYAVSTVERATRSDGAADFKKKLAAKLFGEHGRRKGGSGGYQGSSDFDVYKDVFCALVDAFDPSRNKGEEVQRASAKCTEAELMDQLDRHLRSIQAAYRDLRKCHPQFRALHEYLYYHAPLRRNR